MKIEPVGNSDRFKFIPTIRIFIIVHSRVSDVQGAAGGHRRRSRGGRSDSGAWNVATAVAEGHGENTQILQIFHNFTPTAKL